MPLCSFVPPSMGWVAVINTTWLLLLKCWAWLLVQEDGSTSGGIKFMTGLESVRLCQLCGVSKTLNSAKLTDCDVPYDWWTLDVEIVVAALKRCWWLAPWVDFDERTLKSASVVVPCNASNATAGLGAVFFIADVIVEMAIVRFFSLTAAFFHFVIFHSTLSDFFFGVNHLCQWWDDFPSRIFFFYSTK